MVLQTEELSFGCGEGGTLIGCTFCFNAAHSSCCGLGDQRKNAPRGDWACLACIDHAREQLKESLVCGEDVTESEESDSESEETGESDEGMSIEQIQDRKTTVVLLKRELGRLGLVQSGRKHELVKRLVDFNSVHHD